MFLVGLQDGRGLGCIALSVEITRCLPPVPEEMCPGRIGIDGEIKTGVGGRSIAPWSAVANQIGPDGSDGVRGGIEEFRQRKERAGGEDRNHENDRNDGGEPMRPKQREEEQEKFASRDSEPVERSIEVV